MAGLGWMGVALATAAAAVTVACSEVGPWVASLPLPVSRWTAIGVLVGLAAGLVVFPFALAVSLGADHRRRTGGRVDWLPLVGKVIAFWNGLLLVGLLWLQPRIHPGRIVTAGAGVLRLALSGAGPGRPESDRVRGTIPEPPRSKG